jgi:hypothetical protein
VVLTLDDGHVIQMLANELKHHSEYFKNALSGPWIESHQYKVRLADVRFTTWCYFEEFVRHGYLTDAAEEQLESGNLREN